MSGSKSQESLDSFPTGPDQRPPSHCTTHFSHSERDNSGGNPHYPRVHFTNNKTAGLLSDSLSDPSPPRHGPKGPTWSVPLQIGCSLTQTQTQEEMKLSLSNFHNAGDELNVPVSARAGCPTWSVPLRTLTQRCRQSLLLRLTWCRHRRRCRGKQGVNRRHRHTLRDPPQSFLLFLLNSFTKSSKY